MKENKLFLERNIRCKTEITFDNKLKIFEARLSELPTYLTRPIALLVEGKQALLLNSLLICPLCDRAHPSFESMIKHLMMRHSWAYNTDIVSANIGNTLFLDDQTSKKLSTRSTEVSLVNLGLFGYEKCTDKKNRTEKHKHLEITGHFWIDQNLCLNPFSKSDNAKYCFDLFTEEIQKENTFLDFSRLFQPIKNIRIPQEETQKKQPISLAEEEEYNIIDRSEELTDFSRNFYKDWNSFYLENMKTKTLIDMRELVNGNAAHKADYLLPFGEPGQEQHLSKVISISFFFIYIESLEKIARLQSQICLRFAILRVTHDVLSNNEIRKEKSTEQKIRKEMLTLLDKLSVTCQISNIHKSFTEFTMKLFNVYYPLSTNFFCCLDYFK